jgi:transposase
METGTYSPWVSRLLTELGYEVIVAHAQKVQLITKSNRKRMIDTMRGHWHG